MANVPTIFDDTAFSAFDPFDVFSGFKFPEPSTQVFGRHSDRLMKTDVRETEKGYTLMIDLPGFKKDEVSAELKDGYLTISAQKAVGHEEKQEGRLIRSERSTGSCSRTFYVGEGVKEGDCSAKFEDGILTVQVPKASAVQPEKKLIAIQ